MKPLQMDVGNIHRPHQRWAIFVTNTKPWGRSKARGYNEFGGR